MVDKSTGPFQTHLGPVCGAETVQRSLLFSKPASSERCCEHLHQTLRDLRLHPFLALAPLEWRSAPMDTRAPRAPSIIGWFCRRPTQGPIVGGVAPPGCHPALVAARASPEAMREDAQNESKLVTTPNGLAAVEQASQSPRFDEKAAAIPCRMVTFSRSIQAVFDRPEKPLSCKANGP